MAVKNVFHKAKDFFLSLAGGGDYKMLLIGETGSGKTSLLNLLCNYAMIQTLGKQVDFEQFRQFNEIKLENAQEHQMESKTSDAKLYKVDFDKMNIGIIDTPGFGDSRGIREDKEHVKRIISTLKQEESIHCVCLVINGRSSRMSATLKYVLSEITAILPRTVLNNVVIVFTNTADPLDLNFDTNVLTDFFGKVIENYFCIENPYCRIEKARAKKGQLSLDKIAQSLKKSFDETADSLSDMFCAIKDFQRIHTSQFIQLYEKKQEIEKKVLKLLVAYDNQRNLEEQIDKAQKEAEAAFHTKSLNKDYSSKQKLPKIITVDTDRHNTLCGSTGCYSNCHEPCYLSKSFDKEVFKSCGSIGGTNCRVCGHSYMVHYHNEVKFEKVEETLEFVDEEMKEKFEAAQSAQERAKIFHHQLETKRGDSEKERAKLSVQLLSIMDEFQKLGISRNYAKLLENQLAVIEQRLEAEVGDGHKDLRSAKKEMEKKLTLVNKSLNEPWSSDCDPKSRRDWACTMLGFDTNSQPTKEEIEKCFKEESLKHHPDQGGSNDLYKRVLKARDVLLETN